MLQRLRLWQDDRRKYAAIKQAIATFHNTHGIHPMSASIARSDAEGTIIQVAYPRRGTAPGGPLDYTWFITLKGKDLRELSAEEAASLGLERPL